MPGIPVCRKRTYRGQSLKEKLQVKSEGGRGCSGVELQRRDLTLILLLCCFQR